MDDIHEAARETKQASREATRRAAEGAQRAAKTAADASAGAARASADLMQRNVETVQRAWEAAGQTAGELASRSMEQLARASGLSGDTSQRATQQSAANVERILQSGTAIAGAIQNISREFLEFAQKRMQQNISSVDTLANCRSPHEFLTAHSDLVRNNIEDFLASARRIAEISMRMADEATEKISHSLAPRQ